MADKYFPFNISVRNISNIKNHKIVDLICQFPLDNMLKRLNYLKVALKRQQAAEDAIALGIRAVRSGENRPPGGGGIQEGQIIGLPSFMTAEHRYRYAFYYSTCRLGRIFLNS